jgi:hypothetical protein
MKKVFSKKNSVALVVLAVLGLTLSFSGRVVPGPATALGLELGRVSLTNPEVDGPAGYDLLRGAAYDPGMSHQPGSGAIDLSVPKSQVQTNFISVMPGKTYSFSFYSRSDQWPVNSDCLISAYDGWKKFRYNWQGSYQGLSSANTWEESAVFFTAQEGDRFVKVLVSRLDGNKSPNVAGHLWVDDFNVSEGIKLRSQPAAKKSFPGSKVRIDSLGNFEVLEGGQWKPFFPFAIYQDTRRPSYQIYSDQGFNCIMFNQLDPLLLEKARSSISTFNPHGMWSMAEIAQYIQPKSPLYGQISDLTEKMQRLRQSPGADRLFAYYWDNEAYNQGAEAKKVIETVRTLDRDSSGSPSHPIYMLQGNQGLSRNYNALVDSVGDYGNEEGHASLSKQSTRQRFYLLRHLSGQRNPVGIGVVSDVTEPVALRQSIYQLLLAGAKGIAYYRDGSGVDRERPDITRMSIWNEFPQLRREIDRLLPVLREPDSDTPGLCSNPLIIACAKRHEQKNYLLLVNPTTSPQSAEFTMAETSLGDQEVRDFFSGEKIAVSSKGRFQWTMTPQQVAVLFAGDGTQP